jgi:hypothetical protein
MTIVETVLLSALPILLVTGSAAGLLVGAVLILRPHWLARASLTANRWISTRHIAKFLDIPINADSWFYRYPRASGLATLAGASYVLYFFSLRIDTISAGSGYGGVFLETMVLIALLGAALALLVSLIVLFRPSLLRKFEAAANEWISLRDAIKPLELLHNNVDEFTFRHTQQMGVVLVLCSIYTLAVFTFLAR